MNQTGLLDRLLDLLRRQRRGVRQLIKFAVVGTIGAAVDFGTLVFLKESLGFNLYVANTISVTAAICSNFLWNSLWTFRGSFRGRRRHRFMPFVVVSVIGLGINQIILYTTHEFTGLDDV